MKTISIKFGAIVLCLLCLTVSMNAQKRKPATRKAKTTVAATTVTATAEIKSGANKVSTQIKNLSKFIYKLGDIAINTENLEREIAAGKGSRNAPNLYQKNKQAVVLSIRDFRAGFAALEIEFRTKPALKNYLFPIQGISDMTGLAEDQATAGQLVESGKTLLLVIEKLSDALAVLP